MGSEMCIRDSHKTDEVEQMMTDFVAHVVPLLEAKEP